MVKARTENLCIIAVLTINEIHTLYPDSFRLWRGTK